MRQVRWDTETVHNSFQRLGRGTLLLLSGLIVLGLAAACSDAKDRSDPIGNGPGGQGPEVPSESCEPGRERPCGYTLEQSEDIITCFKGTQTCQESERWGKCTDGTITTQPASRSFPSSPFSLPPGSQILALSTSTPGDCMDACDPGCLHFIEPGPDVGTPEAGGGGSSSFPGIPGSCAHGLCDSDDGAPLDPSCDPCVQTVCNVDATCCSSAWDDLCTDLVYTECAGTNPPLDLCDFGVFSLSGLVTANRPSAGAAIGAVGDVTIGTDASPGMIVTKGNLHITSPNGASITTPGGVWVGGNATADNGGGAQYTGDWHVGGGINLSGGNTIVGEVYSGSQPQNVTIIGGQHYPSPAPNIEIPQAIPALPQTCPGGTSYDVNGGTRTLTPGDYGTISMSNQAKLTLNGPGTYTFTAINGQSMNTSGGIQIGTNAAPGTYEVIICGDLRLGSRVNIIGPSANPSSTTSVTPLLANPERLVMYVGGDVTYSGTDNAFVGVLIVPNGKYTAGDRTNVRGAIWANDFQAGTDMYAGQLDPSVCKALDLSPPTSSECPVENDGLQPGANEPCETGADCQMNQRCSEVLTADCSHSKCLSGDALEDDCDSCVAEICGLSPTCCSVEWTQDCVDMVGTVCDASCGAVAGCSHDMCAVGSTLEQGCDTESCTDTVCSNASFAYCCDDTDPRGWDQGCVDQVVAVCSGTPSSAGGSGVCSYAVHWTTSYSGTATVTGGSVGNGQDVPSESFSCGTGTQSYGTTTINPGNFGHVFAGGWGNTLTLNAGTYYMASLTVSPGVTLRMPASGNVRIFVCGSVTFGQNSSIQGLSTGADLLRLQLYTSGNLSAGPQAALQGVIIGGSGSGTVTLQGPTTHQGVIWSKGAVNMVTDWGSNPTVTNTIPEAACDAAGYAPVGCPVTTEPAMVTESGTCLSNDDGWEEPYCSGYDLAAGYVCGAEVPVCNHGTSPFPGGSVTVYYWDIAAAQFATTSPDTSLGTACTEVLPAINPGQCEMLACAPPTGADATFMIDPAGALSECHGHRADNWTWRDDDYACGGATSWAEYEYEATCPKGSSALWKNLTWDTEVPAGSSIQFSAKVGEDLIELAGESYVPLGVAEPGPPNTTVCSLAGPSPPCPIGLTDELSLGLNQGQFLSVRIDSDHSGGTPSVNDWTISYTCRWDQ